MRSFATTQSCIPSRMMLGSYRSRSPTCSQILIGFTGDDGISRVWYSHAPPGVSALCGHC